jgi:flagellar motor switch protein FliM
VADFELEIARAQRSRVKVEKITHLQDEAGDIISIVHPYTQRVKKMFIADLKRRFKASVGKDNGYFLDEIEGWII